VFATTEPREESDMAAGKILVVDDDPEVRMATRDFLTSKGHDVTLAEDGVQALKLLAAAKADVVLLDVAMPGMDGMETLRRIVASYPNLPVIMVTANADIEITSKVLQLGAADYVPKPFDLDYLDQAINIQLSSGR
jgi:DNA-binding response OmpR family regulator